MELLDLSGARGELVAIEASTILYYKKHTCMDSFSLMQDYTYKACISRSHQSSFSR